MAGVTATSPDGRVWELTIEHDLDGDDFTYPVYVAIARDNGEQRYLDWSRFDRFSGAHFVAFVAAGFPPRPGLGPWFLKTIEALPEFGSAQLGEAA